MHENAIKKIEGLIRAALYRFEYRDGQVDTEKFSEHTWALALEVVKHKGQWVTEIDVVSIFFRFSIENILAESNDQNPINVTARAILGENGVDETVTQLSNYLINIPRSYEVYLPLPKLNVEVREDICLGGDLFLVSDLAVQDVRGLRAGMLGGLLGEWRSQDGEVLCLKAIVHGYCGTDIDGPTMKHVLSSFKILMQHGLSSGLFQLKSPHDVQAKWNNGNFDVSRYSLKYVDVTDRSVNGGNIELPIGLNRVLDRLELGQRSAMGNAIGHATIFESRAPAVLGVASALVRSELPPSHRVRLASECCFDSLRTDDTTMEFLKICIGFEALLGEGAQEGSLTATLADRCAFLVTDSIQARIEMRKTFRDFYRIRSSLVHGESLHLEHSQKWYLEWGRNVLEMAIQKEIQHLRIN